MKTTGTSSDPSAEYGKLLNLLTRTLKYLDEVGVDSTVLESYKNLIRYLRVQPLNNIETILGRSTSRDLRKQKRDEGLPSDQIVLGMTAQQILDVASSPETTRGY